MGDAAPVATAGFRGNARFELLGRLGRGGMGVVYSVFDRHRGVRMALKGLQAPAPDNILRFKAEFRALRDIEHPNLLRLGELFEEDGRWYFTMELVEGRTFLEHVRGARGTGDDPSTGSLRHMAITVAGPDTFAGARKEPEVSSVTLTQGSSAMADEATMSTLSPTALAPVAASSSRALSSSASLPSFSSSFPSAFSTGVDPLASSRVPRLPVPLEEEAPNYDPGRLRASLAQLTLALDALHRAGMVHRDVKPSNVLVDGSGRVVLLDFGVVADRSAYSLDDDGAIIGTASYMAPEQACGEAVQPAADWYAMGVLLYQVLTGRLPYHGTATEVLAQKVTQDPPAPTAITPGVPHDLNLLCMRLLARDVTQRPDAREILELLGAPQPDVMLAQSRHGGSPGFVGRAEELAALEQAFAKVCTGTAVHVFVEGPSGIGKSAVVARFVENVRSARPDTLVLRGRCHENETVPYNAFDGVVDDLSRALRTQIDAAVVAGVSCARAVQLFPSLGSVGSLAEAAEAEPAVELAPVERRQRAFDELRDIVARVARARPTIVVIDDVHWADAESLLLLAEWTRGPAPPVLLVATARPTPEGNACAALGVARGDVRILPIEGLSAEDARTLAAGLLAEISGEADVDSIIEEAAGHPMFLGELVQFAVEHGGADRTVVHLDEALLARVARLSPLAQKALRVVAAAGLPVREAVVRRVLKAPRTALAAQLSVLRSARLLRSAGARQGDLLEPFHDRVREAVYGSIDAETKRVMHRRLGLLLEKEAVPHEVLLAHFEKSGDGRRAVHHALLAAKQAELGLAFERAASLYAYALRAGFASPEEERALRTTMGEMLQKAGRPKDAAVAFDEASRTGAPSPEEVFALKRRVAEQYLKGGYLEEGIAATNVLLAHLGESRPQSRVLLMVLALWHALLLSFTRFKWTSRDPASLPAAVKNRLDVYIGLGCGLAFLDSMRGATFSSKATMLCVRAGDDLRIAQAGASSCIGISARGDRATAERLLAATHEAAARIGTDLARFYANLADCGYTFLLANDSRATLEKCELARSQWSKIGERGGWESDLVEQFQLWALAALGRLTRLVAEADEGVRFARAMGNRFRESMFRASFPQKYLLADDAREGDADVLDAVREWVHPDGAFATPDYWVIKSRSLLAGYGDHIEELGPALEAEWRRYDRSSLGVLELLATESADIRANLALRQAIAAKRRNDKAAFDRHVAEARRRLRYLKRSPLRFAVAMRHHVHALLTLVTQGFEAARPLFEATRTIVEDEGFDAQLAGVRYTLGRFLGGDEGRAHRASAEAWVASQGAKSPERMLRLLAPGVALLDP